MPRLGTAAAAEQQAYGQDHVLHETRKPYGPIQHSFWQITRRWRSATGGPTGAWLAPPAAHAGRCPCYRSTAPALLPARSLVGALLQGHQQGLLQEHLAAAGGSLCHCYRSTAPALPPARSLVTAQCVCYRGTRKRLLQEHLAAAGGSLCHCYRGPVPL